MLGRFRYFLPLSAILAVSGQHQACADAATEAALRAALQTATAQIAQLEDQVANLQASQAPDVATIEALRAQLQNLQTGKTTAATGGGGETAADKAKSDAALAALKRQLTAQEYSLNQSQTAYQTASRAADSAGEENTSLKTKIGTLNAGLDSCRSKNVQLFTVSNQILDAYSHKDDLLASIADREPFIGFKRVQLQNIVQDDQDKIYDNQITPSSTP
jgi:chromosome segregation ATPase